MQSRARRRSKLLKPMLRLPVRKLPQLSSLSPPSAATLLLRLPVGGPVVADRSSPTAKPYASSRGLSSEPDPSSSTFGSPLSTLTSYGVPEEQAFTILAKFPALRNSDPENVLKPKLDFLLNAGFTYADMAEVLTANPYLLDQDLESSIAPAVHFLKTILPSEDFMVRVLKYTTITLKEQANIKVLKAHGVPGAMILTLLRYQPRALSRSEEDFAAAVEIVEELGLEPTSARFVVLVGVLSYMSRSSFQRKVDLYMQLGWSEEAVYTMLKRNPECMKLSDKNIRAKMEYFTKKIGWGFEFVAMNPVVLSMSLERRIIPRCVVLNLLMVKGLLRKNTMDPLRFVIGEKRFYRLYVRRHEEEVPEVVKAYEGKIEFQGWEWLKDEEKSSSVRKS